jgi:phosphatidylserine decarboxylase
MTKRRLDGIRDEFAFAAGNWLPRRTMTRFMHWLARRQERWLVQGLIWLWQHVGGLDLSESADQQFATLNECFTRRLRPGARTLDPDQGAVLSPCDGIIMACGRVCEGLVLQAKRHVFSLDELLNDVELSAHYRSGSWVTLRLTPDMYHRFHAPASGRIVRVDWFPGDLWNVHPPAVRRVPRLYCRNERAVIRLASDHFGLISLVPVAAIMVGSLRVRGIDPLLGSDSPGPATLKPTDGTDFVERGQEMGWFEQGSTIIVLLPESIALDPDLHPGERMLMGARLGLSRCERLSR